MKKQNLILIIVVGFIAGIVSFLITQTVFVSKDKRDLSVQKVDPISSEFQQPDKTIFNDQAINPTQLIKIGEGSNPAPF